MASSSQTEKVACTGRCCNSSNKQRPRPGEKCNELHELHELAGPRGSFQFTRRPVQTGPDRSLNKPRKTI